MHLGTQVIAMQGQTVDEKQRCARGQLETLFKNDSRLTGQTNRPSDRQTEHEPADYRSTQYLSPV